MVFVPQDSSFINPTQQYRNIWSRYGNPIIHTLEKKSGLTFSDSLVKAFVFEGMSYSGDPGNPMKLRASYDSVTKAATMVHELGHRLMFSLRFPKGFEEHAILFLFLYDAWTELFGKAIADQQVAIESGRKGYFDYAGAWRKALALGAEGIKQQMKQAIADFGNHR